MECDYVLDTGAGSRIAEFIIVIFELCKAYYIDYINPLIMSTCTGSEGLCEEAWELKMG
jgi:hypothetical protein